MRLLLIQPTTKYPDHKPLRSRTLWLVGITLPYLAGLTPKDVQVELVDDRLSPIPFDRPYDLVGITCTCATSPRAYEIAGEFRQGTPRREQLQTEGRMHNPEAERYLGMICNFFPRHMTPEECEQGVWRCFEKFYSLRSIVRRLLWPPNGYVFQGLPSNLFFHWAAKRRLDPVDFY